MEIIVQQSVTKKSKLQKLISFTLLICTILLQFTSCGEEASKVINASVSKRVINTEYDSQIKGYYDFTKVTENNKFRLDIKGNTAECRIYDKSTNAMWYSNPQGINDGNILRSQVNVEYKIKDGDNSYNTASDSVQTGQYTFEKINDGIRVNYLLGNKPTIFLVPQVLSIQRAHQLRNKMTESDQSIFDQYYSLRSLKDFKNKGDRTLYENAFPILSKHDAYVLPLNNPALGGNTSGYIMEMIQQIFLNIGYTEKDLEKDNKENLVTKKSENDNTVHVSLEYKLENDSITATVPKNSISFDRSCIQVTKITMLPYFGAADSSKKGYIFVPDGSGAIINLNNGKNDFLAYDKKIYGQDRTVAPEESVSNTEQSYMPVFGLKEDDNAFLGIIEQGDASAEVYANINGNISPFNIVNAPITINTYGAPASKGMSASSGMKYQPELLDCDLIIRYMFLNGQQANYTGMAKRYQKYLIESKKLLKANIQDTAPLSITTIGAVVQKKPIIGIPIEMPLALTTYDQSEQIIQELKKKNVHKINLQLKDWCNNANLNTPFNKISYLKSLGGLSAYQNLLQYTMNAGVNLYPQAEILYVSRNGFTSGYNENSDASRMLDNTIAHDFNNSMTTLEKDKNTIRSIVSPSKYENIITKLCDSFQRIKTFSLGDMGSQLNGDYKEGNIIDRQKASGIVANQISKLAQKGFHVAVNGGNFYTLSGISIINEAPMTSGHDYICDAAVPFYQIVLHGFIPYTSTPLNLSSDFEKSVLQCIETGTIPSFEWTYEDNNVLMEAKNDFYSVNYKGWIDKAVSVYKEINTALSDCWKSKIIDHTIINDDLVKVTYENGKSIYINYSDNVNSIGDIQIQPKSYFISKGVEIQ